MLSLFTGAIIALEISLTIVSLNRLGYLDKIKNLFKKQRVSNFTTQPNLKAIQCKF